MSTLKSSTRLAAIALLAISAAGSAMAFNYTPGDSTTYQTANARVLPESDVQPGPIAQHLIYLGESRGQAIAQARTQGEQPRASTVLTSQQTSSGYQAYEREMGLSHVGNFAPRKARVAAPTRS
ncbi:MAG TPA: hypothetical protein VH328_05055 [Burkholderiaceae bacterium]|nr:hypothetical protein [Burkholderiaceae bacterium]